MLSKILHAHSAKELNAQLASYQKSDFKATFSIVFCSPSYDLNEIISIFIQYDIDVFGASSAGEILNDAVYDTTIVGILFDLNRAHYRIYCLEQGEQSTYQTAFQLGLQTKNSFEKPALLVASGGITANGNEIVTGLKDAVQKNIPIYGGLAADDLNLNKTYAFSREKITEYGLVGIVFNNEVVEVKGLATCGWEAVGTVNTITKAKGNVVYTINNEPALDVFVRYFGYFDSGNIKGKPISTISAQYPLQIIRKDGYSVLRSPLIGSEKDKTLMLAGGVQEGDKFRFSIAPGFEVIDKTITEFNQLKEEAQEADALVLFSCKGRHAALGPLIEDEIKGIYNYWKVPLAGFFCYGEIGVMENGICDFHNETCSLVVLKQKTV